MRLFLKTLAYAIGCKWRNAFCLVYFDIYLKHRLNAELQALLPAHARKGVSGETLAKYSVRFCHYFCDGYIEYGTSWFYWDTTMGILLEYDGQAVAGIGFEPQSGALCIRQLQGVKGREKYLTSRIQWEQLLIRLLIRCTRRCALYREVRMITATDSRWWSYNDSDRCERMRRRYDGTAADMGFWWHPKKYYVFEFDG